LEDQVITVILLPLLGIGLPGLAFFQLRWGVLNAK